MALTTKHANLQDDTYDLYDMTPTYFQDNPVKCDKLGGGCNARFPDVIEMKIHKFEEPDHFYCKICDVDCEDYEALTQHKVDVMAPYIEKRVSAKEVRPKHIVCEFCGKDFPTFGGRKMHRQQVHPANQDLVCSSDICRLKFVRAADLVKHWEEDRCSGITRYQFLTAIQQKHIMRQIMVDPKNFLNRPQSEDKLKDAVLLSERTQRAKTIQAAGTMTRDKRVDSVQLTKDEMQSWPLLPNNRPAKPSKYTEVMSFKQPSSQAVGQRTYADMADRSSSTSNVTRDQLNQLDQLDKTMGRMELQGRSPPAKTSDAANGLRPWQKRPDTSSKVDHHNSVDGGSSQSDLKLAPLNKGQNLMTARWWDPTRKKEYNLEDFHNKSKNLYQCPFADCEREFHWEYELAMHIQEWHAKVQFRCLCAKLFKTAASLVAHSESPGSRCKAGKDPAYRDLIHMMTGGFLEAKAVEQPGILPADPATRALVKHDGSDTYGVMETKYETTTYW